MRAACVLILASLTVSMSPVLQCQDLPGEGDPSLDELFQRAEALLIRSILTQMQDENNDNGEQLVSPTDWMEKRQHPGKREDSDYEDDAPALQKRQHPGKREDEESARLRRQHPGKREDEESARLRRQHPGKRLSLEQMMLEEPSAQSELSKRQHPGKRYLMLLHKRQHPGRREEGDFSDLEKRQHPGKRLCEDWDVAGCDQASILLELLDNVNKSRAEEKRQHPGKRLELEDDLTEQE